MAAIRDIKLGVKVRTEAEIKAEALREAAEDLYSDKGPGNMFSTATWLRERADRIEAAGE